jgi:hypothetical protein
MMPIVTFLDNKIKQDREREERLAFLIRHFPLSELKNPSLSQRFLWRIYWK